MNEVILPVLTVSHILACLVLWRLSGRVAALEERERRLDLPYGRERQ